MTVKYWTNGSGIFRLVQVLEFTNLETGEVTRRDSFNEATEFIPIDLPKPKKAKGKKTQKVKKVPKIPKAAKTSRRGPKAKSKYKGVKAQGKKFAGQCWDKVSKKVRHLGMFESELLAAAAVQEKLGNYGEARRLRNEYEEGDPTPLQEQLSDE